MRRTLTTIAARRRTEASDARLGWLLACVAGAVDTAGFMLAQRYTSHMTGWVAAAGDDVAHCAPWLALASASAVAVFAAGAACCTLTIRIARRRRLHAQLAWPLLSEGAMLVAAALIQSPAALATFLCFAMGWQNALATKVSRAEIRTTHVTGIVTDIGIAFGRIGARALTGDDIGRRNDGTRLVLLGGLLVAFMVGAIAGTWSALRFGQAALLLPAAALAVAAAWPLRIEVMAWRRRWRAGLAP